MPSGRDSSVEPFRPVGLSIGYTPLEHAQNWAIGRTAPDRTGPEAMASVLRAAGCERLRGPLRRYRLENKLSVELPHLTNQQSSKSVGFRFK